MARTVPGFSADPVCDWDSAAKSDTERFTRYFQTMLNAGIYVAPSQYEAGFVSTAHGDAEITATLEAAQLAMRAF